MEPTRTEPDWKAVSVKPNRTEPFIFASRNRYEPQCYLYSLYLVGTFCFDYCVCLASVFANIHRPPFQAQRFSSGVTTKLSKRGFHSLKPWLQEGFFLRVFRFCGIDDRMSIHCCTQATYNKTCLKMISMWKSDSIMYLIWLIWSSLNKLISWFRKNIA